MFKAYVTKFALTTGVFVVDAEESTASPGTIRTEAGLFHGPEWHRDRAAAVTRVAQMREASLKSLRAKLKKLETMEAETLVP